MKDLHASTLQVAQYKTWISIKHFWGPGGPLESHGHLHAISSGSPADFVKGLKQNSISTHKNRITKYLQKHTAEETASP